MSTPTPAERALLHDGYLETLLNRIAITLGRVAPEASGVSLRVTWTADGRGGDGYVFVRVNDIETFDPVTEKWPIKDRIVAALSEAALPAAWRHVLTGIACGWAVDWARVFDNEVTVLFPIVPLRLDRTDFDGTAPLLLSRAAYDLMLAVDPGHRPIDGFLAEHDLHLTDTVREVFQRAGLLTLADLSTAGPTTLAAMPGVGPITVRNIAAAFAAADMTLSDAA